MTQPSLTYTATFDANLARIIGLAPAILYNLLVWQSQSDVVDNYDPDGWFYFTAKRFEALTTYSANWFTKASDKLVEVGLVEKKRMYRHDTNGVSALHFRVAVTDWKSHFSDSQLTQNVSGSHTKCDLYNKEDIIEEKKEITPAGGDFVPPTELSFGAPKQSVVSVRPNKKETDSNKKPYAVAQVVLRAWGYKFNKIGAPIAKLFKAWLDAGFTIEQIIEAGNMMKESGEEYWQKATPIQMLTENAMLWYQTNLKKKALEGMPCREIGGKTYRCDPSTGAIIEEVKF